MPYLALPNGDEIHYQTIGAGPPLALVPGLNGVTSFYDPFIPTLQERFTLILHDHRGAGRSSAPEIAYSIDQMRDDLLAVLDGLGIARCHVVGHSAGGAIAQALAIDYPERVDRWSLAEPGAARISMSGVSAKFGRGHCAKAARERPRNSPRCS